MTNTVVEPEEVEPLEPAKPGRRRRFTRQQKQQLIAEAAQPGNISAVTGLEVGEDVVGESEVKARKGEGPRARAHARPQDR